jgi:SAM-dependent methyltransferase
MDELGARDWRRLQEMRADFLESGSSSAKKSLADYWTNARDLELYDATFGARVDWKWRAVLRELTLRRIVPPEGTVLDWGCGTGVAARAFLRAFGPARARRLLLFDRSARAAAFARDRVREEFPAVAVAVVEAHSSDELEGPRKPHVTDDPADLRNLGLRGIGDIDVLLVSHVLGELDDAGGSELRSIVRRARWVAFVDAGTQSVSRRLSGLRDEMLAEFTPLAPCTHRERCGMLADDQSANWCHQFARSPSEVHRSRHWSLFSRELGIDLRSLPYSFLVLARHGGGESELARRREAANELAARSSRILGRPRFEKASARIDACDRDGVHRWNLLEREDRELFKSLSESTGECPIFDWRIEDDRIREPRRVILESSEVPGTPARNRIP